MSDEVKRLRETRDQLRSRLSEIHTALEKSEARVKELEDRLREKTDAAMCRRIFIQERGLGGAYVEWRHSKGIEGESYYASRQHRFQ